MRFGIAVWVMSLALVFGPAWATSSGEPAVRTYSGVTQAILTCVRDNSRKKHGTVYTSDATNPNRITSETHYFGLTRIVSDFDPSVGTVTYRVLQKPGLASYDQVWDGIRKAIKACW
jgi:hypothetical protein